MAKMENARKADHGSIGTHPSLLYCFLIGTLAALAMSLAMRLGIWMQWSQYSLEMFLGSLVFGEPNERALFVGFIWHLANGGVFAILYAWIFRKMGRATYRLGALVGILHWLISAILINSLFEIHPLTESNQNTNAIADWTRFGEMSLFGSLFLHLMYGTIVGGLYQAKQRALLKKSPNQDTDEIRKYA